MSAIIDLFSQIALPSLGRSGELTIASAKLPYGHDRHVGKDESGRPLILLAVSHMPGESIPISYVLENLRVDHELRCRIVDASGQSRVDRFSVIRCLSTDEALKAFFLRTMDALLTALPETSTLTNVAEAVETLIALFQAIRHPPSGPTLGLWGELLLIAESRQPRKALACWHIDPFETCDFSLESERLEVKCSGDRTRRHYFSLEQCHPPADSIQLVASLFVEPAAGGVSLGELWDQVRVDASDSPNLVLKLDRVCVETLGATWQEARLRRYDRHRAIESLLLFESTTIPRIALPIQSGVSEVNFRSDLSVAVPVDASNYLGRGSLFDAVLGGRAVT